MNRARNIFLVDSLALLSVAIASTPTSVTAGDMYRDYAAQETYSSYSEGCAHWERQGAGERTKCFDCLKQRGGVWINTCKLTPRASEWWEGFGRYYANIQPVEAGAIIPGHGIYCETAEKWCMIRERPGLQGTGCFCKGKRGFARGVVE